MDQQTTLSLGVLVLYIFSCNQVTWATCQFSAWLTKPRPFICWLKVVSVPASRCARFPVPSAKDTVLARIEFAFRVYNALLVSAGRVSLSVFLC